ncbi:MAG: hypothetical protein KatS3mg115_1683 [Candidatus Poribacteria bacterium]|nr:MAG: hypothetical protein KatS3mg115_1683 [Candidatus Poribacteria bacterium]
MPIEARVLLRAAQERAEQELLPLLRRPVPEWTPARLGGWRNRLLAVAYLLEEADSELAQEAFRIVELSGRLWRLVEEHHDALEEIEDYRRARMLDAESELITWGEEFFSGEDVTVTAFLANMVSFFLGWQSNTIWVQAGEKSHRSAVRSYLPEIQEQLWEFMVLVLEDAQAERTPAAVQELARRTEALTAWIDRAQLSTTAQVGFLALLYSLLIRMRMGRLVLRLAERVPLEE